MKKILAIFLALITILSVTLVACNDDKGTTGGNYDNDNDGTDDEFVARKDTTSDTTTDTSTDTGKNNTSGWTDVNMTVYASWSYALRSEPNFNSSIPMKEETKSNVEVAQGDELTVVAEYNDWYKVIYNGKEYYINRYCTVASKEELSFKRLETEEQFVITLKKDKEVNIRDIQVRVSNTDQEHVKTLKGVVELTVVAKNTKWYKVLYNEKEYYLYISGTKQHFDGIPDSDSSSGAV